MFHVSARRLPVPRPTALWERVSAALAQPAVASAVASRACAPTPGRGERRPGAGGGSASGGASGDGAVVRLPFRRWIDLTSRGRLVEEAGVFRPDVALLWDQQALARFSAPGPRLVGVLQDYWNLAAWRRCEALLAPSDDLAAYATDHGWPEERVLKVPLFARDLLGLALPRSVFATDPAAPLLVATPAIENGACVEALVGLLRHLPEAVLWLPLRGKLAHRAAVFARRLEVDKRLRCLAPWIDGRALYAAADVVVQASRNDPLGLAVIDAWAQGKPLVAAAALGPAALIRHGHNGLLVGGEETAALAAAIGRVLDDPLLYDRLAGNGRITYETEHSEARAVEQWLAALYKLSGLAVPVAEAAGEGRTTDVRV